MIGKAYHYMGNLSMLENSFGHGMLVPRSRGSAKLPRWTCFLFS